LSSNLSDSNLNFFRVEFDSLFLGRLLLLFLLLLLLFLLVLLLLLVPRGLFLSLPVLALLRLLLLSRLLATLYLTHIFWQVLHQLCAGSVSIIKLILISACSALAHQLLLFDIHGCLGVLAFLTQQILLNEFVK